MTTDSISHLPVEDFVPKHRPKKISYWLLPAIGAWLCWGVWAFIPKLALQSMSPHSAIFYTAVGDMFIVLPVFAYLKGRLQVDRKGIAITFVASTLTMGAMLAYFYALQYGPVAIVSTVTAKFPVITVILARVFLKEKLNKLQLVAVVMALVAIWLLTS